MKGDQKKWAFGEMKHAEKLIARIVFLEGLPVVGELNALHIGAPLAMEVQDAPTRELLESITKDEDAC